MKPTSPESEMSRQLWRFVRLAAASTDEWDAGDAWGRRQPTGPADTLFPSAGVRMRRVPPGMSGAHLFRYATAGGDCWAVKRWPAGTCRERVAELHRVIRFAADHGGPPLPLPLGPDGATAVTHDGYVWDVCRWLPGAPLRPDADDSLIVAGAASIARFHRAVRPLGRLHRPAPAVAERLRRIEQLTSSPRRSVFDKHFHFATGQWSAESGPGASVVAPRGARTGTDNWLGSAIKESEFARAWMNASRILGEQGRAALERSRQQLVAESDRPMPLQWVFRDVHRGHVLFRTGTVSGILDFDAMRVDTPATDLARWVSGFLAGASESDRTVGESAGGGDLGRRSDGIWRAALAGYRSVSPFSDREEHLSRLLLPASLWISLANWCVWLAIEGRSFPCGPSAVASRLEELSRAVV